MSLEGRSILWVDDQIANYQAHIRCMEEAGIEVVSAMTTSSALEQVQSRHFDAAIIDLLVPSDGGVVLLENLRERQVQCVNTVLSSYSDIDSFREGIEQLEYRVSILEKSQLVEARSRRFVEEFMPALFRQPSENSGKFPTLESLPPTRSVFDVTYSQFLEMTPGARVLLTEMAHQEGRETIKQQFDDGAAWVLLCGDGDEAFRVEDSLDRIPSVDEIIQWAAGRDRVPFQFIRPLAIDDFDGKLPSRCSLKSYARDYPTVTIEIDKKFTMHFDTGSPFTIVDEECVREGWLSASPLTQFIETGKGTWTGFQIEQRGLLHCQESTFTQGVNFKGVTHPNWKNSLLARECLPDCAYHQKGNKGCIFRRGLVGRKLLQDNDVTIAMGRSLRTRLIRGGPRK